MTTRRKYCGVRRPMAERQSKHVRHQVLITNDSINELLSRSVSGISDTSLTSLVNSRAVAQRTTSTTITESLLKIWNTGRQCDSRLDSGLRGSSGASTRSLSGRSIGFIDQSASGRGSWFTGLRTKIDSAERRKRLYFDARNGSCAAGTWRTTVDSAAARMDCGGASSAASAAVANMRATAGLHRRQRKKKKFGTPSIFCGKCGKKGGVQGQPHQVGGGGGQRGVNRSLGLELAGLRSCKCGIAI